MFARSLWGHHPRVVRGEVTSLLARDLSFCASFSPKSPSHRPISFSLVRLPAPRLARAIHRRENCYVQLRSQSWIRERRAIHDRVLETMKTINFSVNILKSVLCKLIFKFIVIVESYFNTKIVLSNFVINILFYYFFSSDIIKKIIASYLNIYSKMLHNLALHIALDVKKSINFYITSTLNEERVELVRRWKFYWYKVQRL